MSQEAYGLVVKLAVNHREEETNQKRTCGNCHYFSEKLSVCTLADSCFVTNSHFTCDKHKETEVENV